VTASMPCSTGSSMCSRRSTTTAPSPTGPQGVRARRRCLSAGVQRMVRSDAVRGVMFTMDTESGFRDVVFITSSYGLAKRWCRVPSTDEFYVHKPMLPPVSIRSSQVLGRSWSDGVDPPAPPAARAHGRLSGRRAPPLFADRRRLLELARYAVSIEQHYGRPMDIDGVRTASMAASTSCRRDRKR